MQIRTRPPSIRPGRISTAEERRTTVARGPAFTSWSRADGRVTEQKVSGPVAAAAVVGARGAHTATEPTRSGRKVERAAASRSTRPYQSTRSSLKSSTTRSVTQSLVGFDAGTHRADFDPPLRYSLAAWCADLYRFHRTSPERPHDGASQSFAGRMYDSSAGWLTLPRRFAQMKSGHRACYMSRAFAQQNNFIPKDAAPGFYGFSGITNLGTWPITVRRITLFRSPGGFGLDVSHLLAKPAHRSAARQSNSRSCLSRTPTFRSFSGGQSG